MNNQSMLLLGLVKMKHPSADHYEMVEVRGFDIVGFLFPFVRTLFGHTSIGMKLLYCATFWAVPIWAWYTGFSYKKIAFENRLKEGWSIVNDKEPSFKTAA